MKTQSLLRCALMFPLVCCLSACPGPPLFKEWEKPGATEKDVQRTMLDCGFPNVGAIPADTPGNETVKMYLCMKRKGFQHASHFNICDYNRAAPACVEEKRGYPVSIAELESLPFTGDPGFWTLSPTWNSGPAGLIGWRAANASRHSQQRVADQPGDMAAMYACGYPNPLGSGSPVSVGETARVQVCMQKKGYVPDRPSISLSPMVPVCRQYPMLPVCAALKQDSIDARPAK